MPESSPPDARYLWCGRYIVTPEPNPPSHAKGHIYVRFNDGLCGHVLLSSLTPIGDNDDFIAQCFKMRHAHPRWREWLREAVKDARA